MSSRDRKRHEYLLRRETKAAREEGGGSDTPDDHHERFNRHDQQGLWVDFQIRQAMSRGEFDNLPGAGKPIPGLDRPHDPDWWVKSLVERERITNVLPEPLAIRKADAELQGELDRLSRVADVRSCLEAFNARVVEARRQLQGGPPVITPLRDVDAEIAAWSQRREDRLSRLHEPRVTERHASTSWWRRRRRG